MSRFHPDARLRQVRRVLVVLSFLALGACGGSSSEPGGQADVVETTMVNSTTSEAERETSAPEETPASWFSGTRVRDDYQTLEGAAVAVSRGLSGSSLTDDGPCIQLREAAEAVALDLPSPDAELDRQVEASIDALVSAAGNCESYVYSVRVADATGSTDRDYDALTASLGSVATGMREIETALIDAGVPLVPSGEWAE